MEYSKTLGDLLENSSLFRHLINKAKNKRFVEVKLRDGTIVSGVLVSVDHYLKMVELATSDSYMYIPFNNLLYLKVHGSKNLAEED